MCEKMFLLIVTFLLLLSLTFRPSIMESVKATPAEIIVQPGQSIQEAIDNAGIGDTILVETGTYYEHVVINKTVALVGKNPLTTIIDGKGEGIVVRSNAPNVEIRGFTIQNGGVSAESGILVGSTIGNIIRDNIIRNSAYGITLSGSNGCSIIDNIIMNNSWAGVQIKDSSSNEIYENTIAYNIMSVWITSSSSLDNTFYHNNFIDNLNPPQSFGVNTAWDNGTEGNYWGNYTGVDANGDGVGDNLYETPLVTDYSPLIIPTRPFPVVVNDVIYPVALLSNSTVSGFYFSQSSKEIGFYVTGLSNKTGFCNVTIPNTLLWGSFTVLVNESPIDLTPSSNTTHNSFYFTFQFQSTSKVRIMATEGVPEFPAVMFLPLFIIVTLVAAILRKRKEETSNS